MVCSGTAFLCFAYVVFVILFFIGKEMDTWFATDASTGVKQILSFNKADKTCPLDFSDFIFIGRSGMYFKSVTYLGDLVIHVKIG
jgi:hypothetical protein